MGAMVRNLYQVGFELLSIKMAERDLRRTFQISREKRGSKFSLDVKDAGFIVVLMELKIWKIEKTKFDAVKMPPHRKHATLIAIINRFTAKYL